MAGIVKVFLLEKNSISFSNYYIYIYLWVANEKCTYIFVLWCGIFAAKDSHVQGWQWGRGLHNN